MFPILNPPPPASPSHPSVSSQCTNPKHPVSCIKPGLVICFTYGNIHVSLLFSQIIPPLLSPTESKRLFYTSVSLLLSRIQGYRYHLSSYYLKNAICAVLTDAWLIIFFLKHKKSGLEVNKGRISIFLKTLWKFNLTEC